ncbi:hypothetical protein GCM10009740_03970 [Terrabacter terrae]|uniref:Uncharacterized protein n=1 Tax=Terrabacter terrae TaxID=318434 RepID=A0ABN2TTM7_9MICO
MPAYFTSLARESFRIEPHHFIADGNRVVVPSQMTADGQSADEVDVATFGFEGRVTKLQVAGDTALRERL